MCTVEPAVRTPCQGIRNAVGVFHAKSRKQYLRIAVRHIISISIGVVGAPGSGKSQLGQMFWEISKDYFEEHGYPPSIRDVQHALGLMATSAAKARISDAATAGMIHVTPGIARGIALVD